MTTPRRTAKPRSPKVQARVTNHCDLLENVDGRTGPARRFRDLVTSFISDSGGLENCSAVRLGLLRRLAAASVLVEQMESRATRGEAVDISEFCTLASTTVRLSMRLGLERRARDTTPTLQKYLESIQAPAHVEAEPAD